MNRITEHEPRSSIRMDARLDATTRQKVDDLAKHFHQPRAAVLCHIMHWGLSRERQQHLTRARPKARYATSPSTSHPNSMRE